MTTQTPAFRTLVLAGVAVLALGGCRSAFMEDAGRPRVEHRAEVEAFDLAHTVARSAAAESFDAAGRERLDAFMARQPASARSVVVVDAAQPEAENLGETVAAWLRHQGYRPRGPVAASDAAAGVQVVVRRYAVTLPACPDYTKYPGDTFENRRHSNWGCATATNLGLMVADPGDLIEGRDIGPANGKVQAEAFKRYLDGETKAITPEDVGVVEEQQRSGGSGGGDSGGGL